MIFSGMAPKGGGGLPSANVCSRVGHRWSKSPILPNNLILIDQINMLCLDIFLKSGTICLILSYFVSIGHILSHLVKFCLFQSYFAHIMCYFWYLFSWSIILFSWSDIHQIAKISQNVVPPPQRVASRIIPAKCVPFID